MWNVILSILSIIGILLLILLGLFLAVLLIVLFYPVTYRIRGKKTSEEMWLTAKVNWLFGLVRVRFSYPEPGNVVVKLLWKTVFDSSVKKEKASGEQKPEGAASSAKKPQNGEEQTAPEEKKAGEDSQLQDALPQEESTQQTAPEKPETAKDADEAPAPETESGLLGKISKIKYTIQKIYDKIKKIWENISYYSQLFKDENTAALWRHVKLRLGRILKSIRPRHIRAELLFGTGSPDTTGYAFGLYGILSPFLGSGVCVTPDFSQAILQGEADISGHITAAVLCWNTLRLVLDRKLHLFIKLLKRNSMPAKPAGNSIKNEKPGGKKNGR